MKHLLIILISILLLSSPVIGDNHKGETLYGWGECCDYKWMGFGDKDTHPKYQGQVKDGKPNGLGVMTYPPYGGRYGRWKTKYVGSWKDGKEWNGKVYIIGKRKIRYEVVNGKRIDLTPPRTPPTSKRTSNQPINYETSTHHPHLNPSSFFSCDWR